LEYIKKAEILGSRLASLRGPPPRIKNQNSSWKSWSSSSLLFEEEAFTVKCKELLLKVDSEKIVMGGAKNSDAGISA